MNRNFISAALLASTSMLTQEKGFLAGRITIGPLCPVETDPPQPECLLTAETIPKDTTK
ncbi:MAG: hypothetical protein HY514_03595 [Candidatus Aenigmarchaeota archaeon]|nr:hypothetical protein [Candidatus Aenigmarchaeota archaeon]